MVYTGLHGTGAIAVPAALKAFGFRNVHEVASQAIPDGDFPTVASPNPEEGPALAEAVALAKEVGASLVMGTDPDSDRVGLAVPDGKGDFVLLNGNETAALLTDHVLSKWQESGKLDRPSFVAKTVVTTNLLVDLAEHYGVEVKETLTGFKFIAEAIRKAEGALQYVVGGEESYGYLVGDQVRDKDAVQSCCLLAELAHELDQKGERMLDRLAALHRRHGAYKEGLVSLVKEGREGKAQIDAMMVGFRTSPPAELAGERVVEILDFQSREARSPEGEVLRSLVSGFVQRDAVCDGSRFAGHRASKRHRAQDQVLRQCARRLGWRGSARRGHGASSVAGGSPLSRARRSRSLNAGINAGAKASTGPSITEGCSLWGTHARGPIHWLSSITPNDKTRANFSKPNSAPASLLTKPRATRSSIFSNSLASRWTVTTTNKNVSAREAM